MRSVFDSFIDYQERTASVGGALDGEVALPGSDR